MSVIAAFAVPHPPIILPEIGRGEEKKISRTTDAYLAVMRRAAALRPDTIVLISPHSIMYADYFHISPGSGAQGDFSEFRAPEVQISAEYDAEFAAALTETCEGCGLPAGTLGERDPKLDHGTMIPLYFLNKFTKDFKLVRIGLSGLSPREHYRLGENVAQTAEKLGRRVVLIASGDLSHKLLSEGPYGFAVQGPEFDRQVTMALGAGDFLSLLTLPPEFCEGAAECGLRSLQIMAGALDRKSVTPELLSYEGPFGVGYGVAAFEVTGEDEKRDFGQQLDLIEARRLIALRENEDACIRLARLSVETFVRTGKRAALPAEMPPELLSRRAGAFVSLKKNGALRGCIGTIAPVTSCLAEEIMHNGVAACSQDPRFPCVEARELTQLEYSVDVLTEPERIRSSAELDVQRYGVIVEDGDKRGLLLPDLDGVDSVEQQLAIARRKAGISESANPVLYRFEVVRHH